MLTFLQGVVVGIGKIIPGVSGSMIAVSLGIYEKCIDIISNFLYEVRYNVKFLFLLCLGVLTAILFGSKVIYYFLSNHYFLTMCLFVGLIGGTIPSVFKMTKYQSKRDFVYIVIPILFIFAITNVSGSELVIENNLIGYILTFFIGILDAMTMIIPGISGTAIFMMLGVYQFVLLLFSKMMFPFIIFFIIGIALGVFITSRCMNYFLKNRSHEMYLVILGLSFSSICYLIIDTFSKPYGVIQFVYGLIFIGIGYFISNLLDSQ